MLVMYLSGMHRGLAWHHGTAMRSIENRDYGRDMMGVDVAPLSLRNVLRITPSRTSGEVIA